MILAIIAILTFELESFSLPIISYHLSNLDGTTLILKNFSTLLSRPEL